MRSFKRLNVPSYQRGQKQNYIEAESRMKNENEKHVC